jgi:hypothetical protein
MLFIKKLAFLTLLCYPLFAAAKLERTSPGTIRYVVRTDPSWDRYTANPSPDMKRWFRTNVWRMIVFSPFWDGKISWFPNAWEYFDLYAIHTGGDVVTAHPDWILTDGRGRRLYIPWGCNNGTCPQYAANIADPAFRENWIRRAREFQRKGYKGLWIDDVNLEFQVGDGNGRHVAPMNRRANSEIREEDWRRHMAEFTEEIRKALPDMELVHNSLWFAGGKNRDSDEFVKRQIKSADYINLERGVTDDGLKGGDGEWSLRAFFAFIDRVHKLGPGVILDNMGTKLEYSAAAYFLVSSGIDAMGAQGMRPDNWWPGLNVDLGDPLGPREEWNGLIRRKFSRGVVFLNPPDSPPVRLKLSGQFRRADGSKAAPVLTIAAADGITLVGPAERSKSLESAIQVVK